MSENLKINEAKCPMCGGADDLVIEGMRSYFDEDAEITRNGEIIYHNVQSHDESLPGESVHVFCRTCGETFTVQELLGQDIGKTIYMIRAFMQKYVGKSTEYIFDERRIIIDNYSHATDIFNSMAGKCDAHNINDNFGQCQLFIPDRTFDGELLSHPKTSTGDDWDFIIVKKFGIRF